MGSFSIWHWLIVLLVVILIFGGIMMFIGFMLIRKIVDIEV